MNNDYPELKYRDVKADVRCDRQIGFVAGLLLGAGIASVLWMLLINYVLLANI